VIDDRTVPFVVLALVVIIAILGRPVGRSSKAVRRRPRPGPETIERLAEALGMGIIVQSVDEGPPALITASFLLDTQMHHVTANGATEEAAWEDLARQAAAWKNHDPRTIRTILGGGV
jgi:hypothetical protein